MLIGVGELQTSSWTPIQGSHLCMWKSLAMASSIGDVCEAARAGLGNLLFCFKGGTWWYQKPEIKKRKREAIQGKNSRITFHALWFYQVKLEAAEYQNLREFSKANAWWQAAAHVDQKIITGHGSTQCCSQRMCQSATMVRGMCRVGCVPLQLCVCFLSEVFLDDEFSDIYLLPGALPIPSTNLMPFDMFWLCDV